METSEPTENAVITAEQPHSFPVNFKIEVDEIPKFSAEELSTIESMLEEPTQAMQKRLAMKPNIDYLEEAITIAEVDGVEMLVPLFNVGDRIIIERYASTLPGNPWLDTQTYRVEAIDDETGNLKLWNVEVSQWAFGNFITGPANGDVYKLPEDCIQIIGKKSRGRPTKNKKRNIQGEPGKKKRGRPKGSKNKPKEME